MAQVHATPDPHAPPAPRLGRGTPPPRRSRPARPAHRIPSPRPPRECEIFRYGKKKSAARRAYPQARSPSTPARNIAQGGKGLGTILAGGGLSRPPRTHASAHKQAPRVARVLTGREKLESPPPAYRGHLLRAVPYIAFPTTPGVPVIINCRGCPCIPTPTHGAPHNAIIALVIAFGRD